MCIDMQICSKNVLRTIKSKKLYTYIANFKIGDKDDFLDPEKSDKHKTLTCTIVIKEVKTNKYQLNISSIFCK